jgi:hypothetical protein
MVTLRSTVAVIVSVHRLVMEAIARARGLDPAAVLATDFTVERGVNRAWVAASRVRAMATYVLVVELDVPRVALARAVGISRQAVHQALHRVEDLRDDPAIDSLIEQVAR